MEIVNDLNNCKPIPAFNDVKGAMIPNLTLFYLGQYQINDFRKKFFFGNKQSSLELYLPIAKINP